MSCVLVHTRNRNRTGNMLDVLVNTWCKFTTSIYRTLHNVPVAYQLASQIMETVIHGMYLCVVHHGHGRVVYSSEFKLTLNTLKTPAPFPVL